MKSFEIEITELLQRIIEVKANSGEEARKIVERKYRNEEIVLGNSDQIQSNIDNYLYSNNYQEIYNDPEFKEFIIKETNDILIHLSIEEQVKLAFGGIEDAILNYNKQNE
jgi:DpnD/PcfM-like protein